MKEPATTTTTLPADLLGRGRHLGRVEQVYTVIAGDAVYSIASKFGVTVEMARSYNEWPEGITTSSPPATWSGSHPTARSPAPPTRTTRPHTDDTEADTTETESTEADTDSTDAPPIGQR